MALALLLNLTGTSFPRPILIPSLILLVRQRTFLALSRHLFSTSLLCGSSFRPDAPSPRVGAQRDLSAHQRARQQGGGRLRHRNPRAHPARVPCVHAAKSTGGAHRAMQPLRPHQLWQRGQRVANPDGDAVAR